MKKVCASCEWLVDIAVRPRCGLTARKDRVVRLADTCEEWNLVGYSHMVGPIVGQIPTVILGEAAYVSKGRRGISRIETGEKKPEKAAIFRLAKRKPERIRPVPKPVTVGDPDEMQKRIAILGHRLRQIQRRHGITGTRIAKEAGLRPSSLSRVLCGYRVPNVQTMVNLSGVLHRLGVEYASPDYLLGYKEAEA